MESEACWLHLSLVAPSKPVNLSFPICKAGWRWVSTLTTPRVAAERKHSAKSSPDRRGVAAPPSSLLPGGVSAEAAPPCPGSLSWPEHTHPADRQTLFWRKSSDEKQKTGSRWNIWLLVTTHCGRKKTFSINKSVRDTGLRAGGVTMGCIHGSGPVPPWHRLRACQVEMTTSTSGMRKLSSRRSGDTPRSRHLTGPRTRTLSRGAARWVIMPPRPGRVSELDRAVGVRESHS